MLASAQRRPLFLCASTANKWMPRECHASRSLPPCRKEDMSRSICMRRRGCASQRRVDNTERAGSDILRG